MGPRALLKTILPLLVCMWVASCATHDTLHDARQLYDRGEVEKSLDELTFALKTDPENIDLRTTYFTYREKAIDTWLDTAARALHNGDRATADKYYERVLALDPDNARAHAGLDLLVRDTRDQKLLKEAKGLISARDYEGAGDKLHAILIEDPDNIEAGRLAKLVSENTDKSGLNPQLEQALQKRLTIEFKDASVRQVFDVLAGTAGVNFVFDKDLKSDAHVNMVLKDTTVKEAMDTMMMTSGLESTIVGPKTFLIYSNTPAKLKDYKPLTVRAFFLSNVDAEDMANTLKTIVKVRDMTVDKEKNLLILRDTPDAVGVAEKLVRLLDLPNPEVMLEVEILEINRDYLTNLGIVPPGQLTLAPIATAAGGTVTLGDLTGITGANTSATVSPLVINANSTNSDVKTLANPRIRVKNRETAKVLIGDRVPNITSTSTSTGFVSENVQYLDVGLKLEITPVVTIDNQVSIKIGLEVSSITNQVTTSSGTVAYQIGTRTASTVLSLKDGENQILAGLINNEDSNTINQTPGLGRIPLLGHLFSSRQTEKSKDEIVLSITPHIIRNTPRQELSAVAFDSGTESSLRNSAVISNSDASAQSIGPTLSFPPPSSTPPISVPPPNAPPPPSPPGGSSQAPAPANPDVSSPSPPPPPLPAGPSATSESTDGNVLANLLWLGPTQVKAGSTFQIQLELGSPQPVSAVPYTIAFDPASFSIVKVEEGDLLKQGGAATNFTERVDANTGQIYVADAQTSAPSNTQGTGGTGILVTLTLKATGPANTSNLQVVSMSPQSATSTAVNVTLPSVYTLSITP